MDWNPCRRLALPGMTVELSEPVLVRRSRRFCWFPSLIRQPNGVLWAVMHAYADIHVSDAFCYLSRSGDGGLTWDEPRLIGDAGLNHLLLPDGSAVVLPYYLRPRGDAIGAPCNVLSPEGELTQRAPGIEITGWPRKVGDISPEWGIAGFVLNGQTARGRQGEYLTTLYGRFEQDPRYSLVLAESQDGFQWRIRSIIAGADCRLEGKDGPSESAVARLRDGRLMCVFRLGSFHPYGKTVSDDDGRTWSAPVAIGPCSVEPSLRILSSGVAALSGGRPGVFVWLNAGGDGENWQAVDIVAHHNDCRHADAIDGDTRRAWQPRQKMIQHGFSGFTSSYTELAVLDEGSLLLIYDRLGLGWNAIPEDSSETNTVWAIRLKVDASAKTKRESSRKENA